MEATVLTQKIRKLLEDHHIEFREIDHAPTPTCELSSKERGLELKYGGKTLLFKGKRGFALFTLSAAKKVDNNKVRKILKSDKLRFATEKELWELIGVKKGALPPFGAPLQNFDLYLDESILENEWIAFNPGVLTKSFILPVKEYLKIIDYQKCSFSRG